MRLPIPTSWKQKLRRVIREERGATMLEWALLLGFVAIPAWVLIRFGLLLLAAHYELVTTMNQMPFP